MPYIEACVPRQVQTQSSTTHRTQYPSHSLATYFQVFCLSHNTAPSISQPSLFNDDHHFVLVISNKISALVPSTRLFELLLLLLLQLLPLPIYKVSAQLLKFKNITFLFSSKYFRPSSNQSFEYTESPRTHINRCQVIFNISCMDIYYKKLLTRLLLAVG